MDPPSEQRLGICAIPKMVFSAKKKVNNDSAKTASVSEDVKPILPKKRTRKQVDMGDEGSPMAKPEASSSTPQPPETWRDYKARRKTEQRPVTA